MKRIIFVFLTALVIFFSCKKIDLTNVGDGLIPAVDNINTFDTILDVITDNQLLFDTTRLLKTESHGLGVIENDPEFGKTTGEIYFSVTPASFGVHPFSKKDTNNYIFDSVVLALDCSGLYGDSLSVEKFNVYEVSPDSYLKTRSDGFRIDTSLVPTETTLLGTKLVNFTTLNDSVFEVRRRDTLRLKNQLRIRLDNALGNRFLSYDTSNYYKNDTNFYSVFRGLAIKVDEAGSPSKRALAYFSLAAANTKLVFYYRVLSSTNIVRDTVATEFGFYSFNAANVNLINRVPAGNYLSYLNNATASDDKVYLQSSPGSFATIRIPNLNTLSNRIIHRAELIFEDIDPGETIFTKPTYLFVDADDTTNKRIVTVPYDFNYENNFVSTFGGVIKNGRYTFNLSRYVQSIVTRKEKDYRLRISAPFRTRATDFASGLIPLPAIPINTPIAAGRVVLAGGNYSANPSKRARLRIIYSKI